MTDSILRSYQYYSTTSMVPFPVSVVVEGLASDLLDGETDGFAIDATTYDSAVEAAYVGGPVGGTVAVINTGDPTDDLDDVALDDSNLTNSGTSAKVVHFPDSPYVRWAPHNYAGRSEDLGHTDWDQNSSLAMTSTNSALAPDGTMTADRKTWNQTGNQFRWESVIGLTTGFVYTYSIFAKSADGSNHTFALYEAASIGVLATATATPTWQKFSGTFTASSGSLLLGFDFRIGQGADTTGDVYLWGAQLNRGPIATPYVANATSSSGGLSVVCGIPQSYDTAASQYGILVEPAATNLALYGDDFTNAAWTKSNMNTAKTATGPDDGANSASTLTATAGNATALQAITSGSSNRITGFWVKRRTGSGNIDLTQDNGSTWQTMTVTASWTRVDLTAATLTNPTVGIRIVTNADAIDVWGFQHETGSVLTSTIPTLGTAVTRAVDDVTALLSSMPFSATLGTVYADFKNHQDGSSNYAMIFSLDDDSGSNRIAAYRDLGGPSVFTSIATGGSDSFGPDLGDITDNVRAQLTMAWQANNAAAKLDANALATDVTVTLPTVTQFSFGRNGNLYPWGGYIYRVVYVPRRVTDGDIPTWRYNY